MAASRAFLKERGRLRWSAINKRSFVSLWSLRRAELLFHRFGVFAPFMAERCVTNRKTHWKTLDLMKG